MEVVQGTRSSSRKMNPYLKYTLLGLGSLIVLGGVSYFVYYQYKAAEGSGEVSARTKVNRKIIFTR